MGTGEWEKRQDSEPGPDFGGLVADLKVAVGRLTERLDSSSLAKPKIPWNAARPVWFTGAVPLTAGAGTLGVTQDQYGPTSPYWWDVRWIGAFGFTAGTVTLYRNLIGGEVLAVWPAAGEQTWSSQKWLAPDDDLVWQAAGITGNVLITGQAIEVEQPWLPEYLM